MPGGVVSRAAIDVTAPPFKESTEDELSLLAESAGGEEEEEEEDFSDLAFLSEHSEVLERMKGRIQQLKDDYKKAQPVANPGFHQRTLGTHHSSSAKSPKPGRHGPKHVRASKSFKPAPAPPHMQPHP